MLNNKWFCETNEFRECWCFIKLHLSKNDLSTNIIGWQTAYANPRNITDIKKSESKDEKELTRSLILEITRCIRKNILIITCGNEVLPLLRSKIFSLNIDNISLHNLRCLSLEEIINRYFLIKPDIAVLFPLDSNRIDVETLYRIFKRIGPLVPEDVFK